MMNDNENMVSDAAAQDMELTDPQGSEPQSADARNAQEASSADDFHRTGRMQLYVRRFMRRPSAVVGLVVLILLILLAIFGSKFSQWSYDEPDFAALASPPSAQHWLGTTVGGSDMYAMIIRGLGRSLTIGIFSSSAPRSSPPWWARPWRSSKAGSSAWACGCWICCSSCRPSCSSP